AVRAAHLRQDLNAGVRYAVVRLAELLHPETPFALSGCAYCDPLAATAAFESAAGDCLGHLSVRYGTVLAASQLLSDALAQETNLHTWYAGDVTRLRLFLGQLRRVPAAKMQGGRQVTVPYQERTTWVRQKLEALTAGSLARFRAATEDPVTGYRRRLLDAIEARLAAAPASERAWAELDHDLCYAAALVLADGRHGPELARAVARALLAVGRPGAAAAAVRAELDAAARRYQVVIVLTGAGSLVVAAGGTAVQVVDRDRPAWGGRRPAAADRALAAFLAERAPARASTPLLVGVEAWDPEHARSCARLVAEAVRDELVADHPARRFSIQAEALVLEVGSGRTSRAGSGEPALRAARLAGAGRAPGLAALLRANALARDETSPALRILHTWVALESLGRDGTAAGDAASAPRAFSAGLDAYLPPDLAAAAALAGLGAELQTTWSEVRELARRSPARAGWRQVEAWLGGGRGRSPSLARLVRLLAALDAAAPAPPVLERAAPPAVAAGFLLGAAGEVGPFAVRRLGTLGRRLARGSRLAKAAEAIQVRCLIAIARLKLARHLAVHQGLTPGRSSASLALGGVHVLDATLQVVRRWMRPGCPPADALAEARRWHDANLASWRAAGDLELDPEHLVAALTAAAGAWTQEAAPGGPP
ncbi:MAG TPA: hypothetical protein VKF59_20020, partial [Candidatus Dormibacteraeota bacterium]|nr:hypothetical protein [Candidatus Dormibacteraeota bacterium]